MAKCPTCGKKFQPCTTTLPSFNWRRIACSYECANAYVEKVEEERRKNRAKQSKGEYLADAAQRDLGYEVFPTNNNKG